jgi:hypothetical protein
MPDTKITALAAITTVDPAADVLPIVDISDTSMAASGTTKKITSNQILGAGGTATLASATITGDLTVDTSTLKVDSANDRVGIGTTSLFGDLNIQTGSNCRLEIYSQSGGTTIENLNNARNAYLNMTMFADAYIWNRLGTEAMRLNSTGLGVGVSPSYKIHASQLVCASDPTQNGSAGRIYGAFLNAVGEPGLDLRRWDGGGGNNHGTTFIQTNLVGDTLFYNGLQASNTRATSLKMTLDASGRLILLASTTTPATLTTNGELTMTATSNTNLRFSYRGSDGTTRVANITLA